VNTGSQADLFPALASAEAFRAWRTDRSQWLPAVTGIARDLALPCDSIEAFSTGTNLVVALDDRLILKLFPPMFRSQFVSEHTSLALLDGRLSVPIPKILFKGEREQWPYLVITRLDGILGTEVWPLLPEDQKENVLGQIGETIAEVQRAPIGDLAHLEPNWKQFIARQIEGCRARHQRLGLPQKYMAGLDELLRQPVAQRCDQSADPGHPRAGHQHHVASADDRRIELWSDRRHQRIHGSGRIVAALGDRFGAILRA